MSRLQIFYRQAIQGDHAVSNLTADAIPSLQRIGFRVTEHGITDLQGVTSTLSQEIGKWVIFDGIWMPPDNVVALSNQYPNTQFITRVHNAWAIMSDPSMASFLMGYGSFFKKSPNAHLSCVSEKACHEFHAIFGCPVIHLPVLLPDQTILNRPKLDGLHIAAFGSLDPLKNIVTAGVAAAAYARQTKQKVVLHVNDSSSYQLLALKSILDESTCHLAIHKWMPRSNLVDLLSRMHLTMQLSYSETLNLIAVDSIMQLVPVIGGSDIVFLPSELKPNPSNLLDVIGAMDVVLTQPVKQAELVNQANQNLIKMGEKALRGWQWLFNYNFKT